MYTHTCCVFWQDHLKVNCRQTSPLSLRTWECSPKYKGTMFPSINIVLLKEWKSHVANFGNNKTEVLVELTCEYQKHAKVLVIYWTHIYQVTDMHWSLGLGPKKKRAKERLNWWIYWKYVKGRKKNLKKPILNDFSLGKIKAASTSRLSDHSGIKIDHQKG